MQERINERDTQTINQLIQIDQRLVNQSIGQLIEKRKNVKQNRSRLPQTNKRDMKSHKLAITFK